MDFAADAGVSPSPQSAFVTCASSLTEGGQTSSHADDTRALMTAVLLGGISQDDLTVRSYSLLYIYCSASHRPCIAMLLCRPFA